MSIECPHSTKTVESKWLLDWGIRTEAVLQEIIGQEEQSMGFLEEKLVRQGAQLQREILEKATQAKADQTPPGCPCCKSELKRLTHDHKRGIQTRFGSITVKRSYGWCPKCRQWFYPADRHLGLEKNAPASPIVQEIAALMVSKMPVAEAEKVIERVAGFKISRSSLDRESKRQGREAQEQRRQMDKQVEDPEGYKKVSEQSVKGFSDAPFTLVIEVDAWNIRERDQWGETEELRRKGEDTGRWHWVYTATCFRLDQRVTTQSERKLILSRGYVATRDGIEEFRQQLWAEALRHGAAQAEKVLVIADGAAWIWNLVKDRFDGAEQRLDYYHASEHLWAVANELHGKGTAEAKQWIKPLLKQLNEGEALKMIETLKQLREVVEGSAKEVVEKNHGYFENQKERLDYQRGRKLGEPIGSGAIESTCRQHQCRFKRPGQFWSRAGDEALLTLETFWRNGRWHLLFPHCPQIDPSLN